MRNEVYHGLSCTGNHFLVSETYTMGRTMQTARIVVDLLCYFLVVFAWLYLLTCMEPYHRGFFCGDESIAHPYKESTVTTLMLFSVGLGLPTITVVVTEGIHTLKSRRISYHSNSHPQNTSPRTFVCNCYKVLGGFLFGLTITEVTTFIAKYSTGRLRPHFLDVCQPNYTRVECVDERGFLVYVEEDVCTRTEHVKQARESFPSGHASLAMYCMVYTVLYLQTRFTWKGPRLLCPLVEFVYFCLALFTSLSRISDYKHHWGDVLGGGVLGTGIAWICFTRIRVIYTVQSDRQSQTVDTSNPQDNKALVDAECLDLETLQSYGTFGTPNSYKT